MESLPRPTTTPPESQRVTRSVVISQMLFTAGHSLTMGGFLNYFVEEFHPSALFLTVVQIAPETSEACSVLTRHVLRVAQSRKWVWIMGLILSRLCALLVPCALLFGQSTQQALGIILVSIIVWHLLQGIAYCSYISWLSEVVPEVKWGEFFAQRKMAALLISILVPTTAGLLRKFWISKLSDTWKSGSYAVIFAAGALLVIASVIPMLKVPDAALFRVSKRDVLPKRSLARVDSQFRYLLATRWWLSFFQGLTQGVLVVYSIRILKIRLEEYYVLSGMMLLLQIVTTWWAGGMCDRNREKILLMWSLLGVSFAMFFWGAATPEMKWLVAGAYCLWGGFGFVNIALHNLTLKLAPRGDNSLHISLSRQGSGLIAGVAGLLGGLCLDHLLNRSEWSGASPYHLLFLISWIGRATALLWLIPLRQPQRLTWL